MAALVQTVQGNGGGYVNSYTKSITPTAGNFLTIQIAMGAADTCTITDDKSDTWVLDKAQALTSQRQVQQLHSKNVVGGATVITVQMGASQYADTAIIIQEWSGIPTTPDPFDKNAAANTTSGTSYSSGATATTTQATELLVGGIAADSSTPAYTGDASFTNLLTQAGFDLYTSVATQYQLVAAAAAYTWTLTNSSARQACVSLSTYKQTVTTIANKITKVSQAIRRSSLY